jgi:hypothetical protein
VVNKIALFMYQHVNQTVTEKLHTPEQSFLVMSTSSANSALQILASCVLVITFSGYAVFSKLYCTNFG